MNLKFILCATALLFVSNIVEGSKILGVFWTPSKSHHILGSALLQALAKKGHNVTLMTPFIDDVDIPNFKQIKLEGIAGSLGPIANPNNSMFQQMAFFFKSLKSSQDDFWKSAPIQQLLKTREQYDLVIALPVLYDGQLALYYHLGAPVIFFFPGASNFLVNKYVANPNWVSSFSVNFLNAGPGSFVSRLFMNTIVFVMRAIEILIVDPMYQDKIDQCVPGCPKISELQNNVSLVFVNSHLSIEPPRLEHVILSNYIH